ncbi:hypothetical protein EV421DRAFT_1743095 [Armillaria borealis]|uniref:Uncharacterized protein n=1 Tax=Armillaria borealis TaxID=47425 RepID=A0AA39MEN0_9AGAR|nr:hypothetical protein EV421DRAFT_1743095 [Armillaria borealis]
MSNPEYATTYFAAKPSPPAAIHMVLASVDLIFIPYPCSLLVHQDISLRQVPVTEWSSTTWVLLKIGQPCSASRLNFDKLMVGNGWTAAETETFQAGIKALASQHLNPALSITDQTSEARIIIQDLADKKFSCLLQPFEGAPYSEESIKWPVLYCGNPNLDFYLTAAVGKSPPGIANNCIIVGHHAAPSPGLFGKKKKAAQKAKHLKSTWTTCIFKTGDHTLGLTHSEVPKITSALQPGDIIGENFNPERLWVIVSTAG